MDKAAALLIDALFARAAYRQLISRDRNINVLGIDAGQVGSNNQLAAIDEGLERRSAALLAGRAASESAIKQFFEIVPHAVQCLKRGPCLRVALHDGTSPPVISPFQGNHQRPSGK